MSVIIIPRKHLRQPQGRVDLRGDEGCRASRVYLLNGANNQNLITRATITPPPVAAYKVGAASRFEGAESFLADSQPAHTGEWTALAVVESRTTTGVRNIFSYGLGSTYSFQLRQNAPNFEVYQAAGTDLGVFANSAVSPQTQVVAAQWDGVSTLRIFVDGLLKDSRPDVVPAGYRTASELKIGVESSNVQYFVGGIALFMFFQRSLTGLEVAELSNAPWQLFRSDPVRIYSLPSGPISLAINSITASNITQTGARITLGLTR